MAEDHQSKASPEPISKDITEKNDQSNANAASEVRALDVKKDTQTRITFLQNQRSRVIQKLCIASSRIKGIPDANSSAEIRDWYGQLDLLFPWLEDELKMTPEIRNKTKIELGLKLMFEKPEYHLPKEYREKAKALCEKWEAENWGKGAVVDDEDAAESGQEDGPHDSAQASPVKRRKISVTTKPKQPDDTEAAIATIKQPPASHLIWGTDGIMHGVALKTGGRRKTYVLDRRFLKRDAKIYGHNKLHVGDWFPYQIVALFRGAHDQAQAGISGNQDTGAYSIIVSGMYHELDEDKGDVLFYSGSGSHDNTNPKSVPISTAGTNALHASLRTRNPIRVLRSSSGKSEWRPVLGLRYDGLYQVVDNKQPLNTKGGRYEQFRLERQGGQAAIDKLRPSPAEQREFDKIGDGFRV